MKPKEIAEEIIEEYFELLDDGWDPWGEAHFAGSVIQEADYHKLSRHEVFKLTRYINKFLRKYRPDWRFRIQIEDEET